MLDKSNPYPHMAAARSGTSKVLCDLIHTNIPMIDLDKELYRALQPHIEAAHTRCFYNCAIVQIPQCHIFLPAHQKSSAEGIRV